MRALIMALALGLGPNLVWAQQAPIGAYRHQSEEIIVAHLSDIDALTMISATSGRVRVLRPADGEYRFGARVGDTNNAGAIVIAGDTLSLSEAGEVRTFTRSQTATRNVVFESGDHQLAGTLTLPAGAGPFPAVVLLHGGGAQTRDFWWVAPFFAARGVAVLAYDKQGVGESSGDWNAAGLQGLADDAVAAMAFLRTQPEIDRARVGLYGSSNGGWVAPLAANRAGADAAFVIARSASARPEMENIAYEVASDLESAGFGADAIATVTELYRLRVRAIRRGDRHAWEAYRAAVAQERQSDWFSLSRLPAALPEWNDENLATIEQAISYWRRNWIEPQRLWRNIRAPVLIQIGASDRSVPGAESASRFRRALSHNRDARVLLYPGADHAMFDNPSGWTRDIPQSDGFAANYLADLDRFIAQEIAHD